MLSGEPTNTNFIVFGLTRPEFEPTIYRTQGEHPKHYATDAVQIRIVYLQIYGEVLTPSFLAAYYSLSYQNSHTQNMLKYKQIFNINISILSCTKYAEI